MEEEKSTQEQIIEELREEEKRIRSWKKELLSLSRLQGFPTKD